VQGVVDTCFIIDWAKYRRRKILNNIFKLLLIHEEALAQIKSPKAVEYISQLLSRGIMRLYPWSSSEEEMYIKLRDEIVADPRIPALERPDILCLIIAYKTNSILLSENIGILRVTQFHPVYSKVRVWTSLEVLEQAVYKEVIKVNALEDFIKVVREYEIDTKHMFSRKRLKEALERVEKWLKK